MSQSMHAYHTHHAEEIVVSNGHAKSRRDVSTSKFDKGVLDRQATGGHRHALVDEVYDAGPEGVAEQHK